jgi:hypothetical protein
VGPTPADYVGAYVSTQGLTNASVIAVADNQLVFAAQGISVLMWWREPDAFQAYIPSGVEGCLITELQALNWQYILFGRDPDTGAVANVTIPGIFPGAYWLAA